MTHASLKTDITAKVKIFGKTKIVACAVSCAKQKVQCKASKKIGWVLCDIVGIK